MSSSGITIFRRVAGTALAAAAVIVWFALAPEDPGETKDFSGDLASAQSTAELNASSTDNVYQQQVVNGWAANDLLEILVSENNAQASAASDQRVPAEVLLLVLGMALVLLTTETPAPGRSDRDTLDHMPAPSPHSPNAMATEDTDHSEAGLH